MADNTPAYKNYETAQSFPARLQILAKYWAKKNEGAYKHTQKLLRSYASGYYDSGYTRNHTINLVDRGVNTISPFLVEGNPKLLVQSKIPKFRGMAYTIQLGLNYLINEMNLAENVLIPAVFNSMFGLTIARTSFEYDRLISINGEQLKFGSPRVEIIDAVDYIGDVSAKKIQDFTFEGDIYKLPTTYAKDFFSKHDKWGNQIADYIYSDGKLMEKYSPQEISNVDFNINRLSLRNYTTFIDIYLYDENTIVTIMPMGKKAKILREVEWKGPKGGPYDKLWYKYFPGTPTPIPPAWSWHDLDVTVNILMDKFQEMAENWKQIIAYSDEAADDMKKVTKTPHMGTVNVNDVNALKQLDFGGINPLNFQYISFIEDLFTKAGATPDVLGGRGSQAPTLGQEQLIFSNATRIVNNMYNRFHSFMTSIVRKLAWEYLTNPLTQIPIVKEIPGVGEMPAVFSSMEDVSNFYSFVFDIIPYSTQRTSPELKYQKLMQFMSQWILPTSQLAASQGSKIDIPLVTRILAEYLGEDTFYSWYKSAVPSELEQVMPYNMLPEKSSGKNTGQSNDSMGANLGSRLANSNRYQAQQAPGMETKNKAGVGNA